MLTHPVIFYNLVISTIVADETLCNGNHPAPRGGGPFPTAAPTGGLRHHRRSETAPLARLESFKTSSEDSWGSEDECPRGGVGPLASPRDEADWPDSDDEVEIGEFESFSGTEEEEDEEVSLIIANK